MRVWLTGSHLINAHDVTDIQSRALAKTLHQLTNNLKEWILYSLFPTLLLLFLGALCVYFAFVEARAKESFSRNRCDPSSLAPELQDFSERRFVCTLRHSTPVVHQRLPLCNRRRGRGKNAVLCQTRPPSNGRRTA